MSLWLDRGLPADARRLSLLVTSWGWRTIANPHKARFMSALNWDDSRYDAAKCELLLDGWCWSWESVDHRVHGGEGFWVWKDGRKAANVTLAREEMTLPDCWDNSPEAMRDRTRLYATRIGIKYASRFFVEDDSAAAVTLAVLSCGLRYDDRLTPTELTPWMAEALDGIDVKAAVRRLRDYGYLAISGDRKRVRFTQSYADMIADYEAHHSGPGRKNRETDFERTFTREYDRLPWEGQEKRDNGEKWFLYSLVTTAPLSITVGGVTEEVPADSLVYIGIATHGSARGAEHLTRPHDDQSNPRFAALRDAALVADKDDPPLTQVMLESHDALEMSWVGAQQRERHLVQEAFVNGHPLFNRQYIEPGLDFIVTGDHTSTR
jgi:hypothetical protein